MTCTHKHTEREREGEGERVRTRRRRERSAWREKKKDRERGISALLCSCTRIHIQRSLSLSLSLSILPCFTHIHACTHVRSRVSHLFSLFDLGFYEKDIARVHFHSLAHGASSTTSGGMIDAVVASTVATGTGLLSVTNFEHDAGVRQGFMCM